MVSNGSLDARPDLCLTSVLNASPRLDFSSGYTIVVSFRENFLPVALVRMGFFKGYKSRLVFNSIVIDATSNKIWSEITNVKIGAHKFPVFLSVLGIPKPLSAEVQKEGVGGYRVASFSNGAQFKQEILEWNLERKYRFRFNPTENFKVGLLFSLSNGPFQIDTGGYDLIPYDKGYELILSSNYRLHGVPARLMHLPLRLIVYFFQRYLLKGIRANCTEKVVQ